MNTLIGRTLVLLFLTANALHAQEPRLINFQGSVAVGGVNFDGSGQFKFALIDAAGTISYWSNDGTSFAGSEPAAVVTLTVTGGLYSVLLGDTTLPNMAAIPESVFNNSDVFLRVWFNDGRNGSQLLKPDQRLATPAPGNVRGVRGGGPVAAPHCWQERANVNGTSPAARYQHTAVWTGSEMIVWGGRDAGNRSFNGGGRYNPAANSWTALSTAGAPAARRTHTAVWTGSEMIVWGGQYVTGGGGYVNLNDGGRYNPTANSWTPVTTTDAPAFLHTAVWTGSEMILWGGFPWNDAGGLYNPAENRWKPVTTSGAPGGRYYHSAVWTGSEMIVWGGYNNLTHLNDGGRYNPADNSWVAVSTAGAPAARSGHTAVWTGSEMIVWGGVSVGGGGNLVLNDGGRYNPAGNSWTAVTTTGAPAARAAHTAVWTGSEMIVWGGYNGSYLNDTFSYTPDCGAFRITSAVFGNGNLTLSFPTVTGRTYSLWRTDTLAASTWTNTGLTAVAGTGATLTFTVPAITPARRFFRVQADP